MLSWTIIDAPRLATRRAIPLRATFIDRPHRFAAIVRLRGGEVAAAHLPNPGRLTGVIAPNCPVLVDGPYPPPRSRSAPIPNYGNSSPERGARIARRDDREYREYSRKEQRSEAGCPVRNTWSYLGIGALSYTLVASKPGATWIGTNTLYANRVFPSLVGHGLFPELKAGSIRAEVAHGRSRFDFQLGSMFVEVKSVTLADAGAGRFPDAVSARAARHCDELAALARSGQPCAIVFVAQRGDVVSVAPEDDVDPAFGVALRVAAKAGVLVLACALDITPKGAARARRVPVVL